MRTNRATSKKVTKTGERAAFFLGLSRKNHPVRSTGPYARRSNRSQTTERIDRACEEGAEKGKGDRPVVIKRSEGGPLFVRKGKKKPAERKKMRKEGEGVTSRGHSARRGVGPIWVKSGETIIMVYEEGGRENDHGKTKRLPSLQGKKMRKPIDQRDEGGKSGR